MDNTATTKTQQSYLLGYTRGVVAYAAKSKSFSAWLLAHVPTEDCAPTQYSTESDVHPVFVPIDDEQAAQRAQWIFEIINTRSLSGHNEARVVLEEWARSRPVDEPKAIILGIMLGYDPFGVWGNPKKKNRPMDLVVNTHAFRTRTIMEVLAHTTPLTHRVVALGLKEAKGRTQRLEPELASWLFGDHSLALHNGTTSTLAHLVRQLEKLSIPHATYRTKGRIEALAITPAVNVQDLEGSQKLTAVQV